MVQNFVALNFCDYHEKIHENIIVNLLVLYISTLITYRSRSSGKIHGRKFSCENVCDKTFSSLWVADENFLTTNNFL